LLLSHEPFPERLTLDVGHREPQVSGRLARVEHREDVGMLQAGHQADLAEEPLGAERGGEPWVEHLECHGPVVPEIVREVNRGHATASELALERVAVGEGSRELFQGLGQRDLSDWDIRSL
jgi:hypothetical protein